MKVKKLLLFLAFLPLSTVCVNSMAGIIPLELGYTDPWDPEDNPHKSPIQIPSVWLDDHTLTFDACHDGYTLNIVSGDVVVYTVYVPANTTEVVLPAYLSGTFELQLIQGNLCFYGEIDL